MLINSCKDVVPNSNANHCAPCHQVLHRGACQLRHDVLHHFPVKINCFSLFLDGDFPEEKNLAGVDDLVLELNTQLRRLLLMIGVLVLNPDRMP